MNFFLENNNCNEKHENKNIIEVSNQIISSIHVESQITQVDNLDILTINGNVALKGTRHILCQIILRHHKIAKFPK